MKVIALKNSIRESVLAVEKIAGTNTSLPILKNILVQTEKTGLLISATNLEIAIKTHCSAKIIEEGEVTVAADVVSQLIQAMPSERINIQTVDGGVEIQTENTKSTILATPSEDFPIIPKIQSTGKTLRISTETLKDACTMVAAASGSSLAAQSELANIVFDFSIDTLVIAATDSFRLCEKTIPKTQFEASWDEAVRLLVPIKTVQEVIRIFQDPKEEIEIEYDQNQILFKTASKECISRLGQGNFPEYQSIIPKAFKAEIGAQKTDLVAAIKTASIVSGKTNEITFSAPAGEKTLVVKALDEKNGTSEATIAAKINNPIQEIQFNARHVLDGLRTIKGEDVYIGISEENKPALIKDAKDGSCVYIVMPVIH